MQVLCISLQESTHKRENISHRINEIGLENVKFFDAIHWKSLPKILIEKLAMDWTNKKRSQDIACTMSHQACWEIVAQAQQPMLIIEDDAVMSATLPHILREISVHINHSKYEIYNLEYNPKKTLIAKKAAWSTNIFHQNSDDHSGDFIQTEIKASRLFLKKNGTAGYIISPAAASRLHTITKNRFVLVEWIFWRPWMNVYHIEPTPIAQPLAIGIPEVYPSSMPIVGPGKYSLRAKFKRLRFTLEYLPHLATGISVGTYRNLVTDLK